MSAALDRGKGLGYPKPHAKAPAHPSGDLEGNGQDPGGSPEGDASAARGGDAQDRDGSLRDRAPSRRRVVGEAPRLSLKECRALLPAELFIDDDELRMVRDALYRIAEVAIDAGGDLHSG